MTMGGVSVFLETFFGWSPRFFVHNSRDVFRLVLDRIVSLQAVGWENTGSWQILSIVTISTGK